jgi:endo-1,4-beta-D-glucanase Y
MGIRVERGMTRLLLAVLMICLARGVAKATPAWPLWENYTKYFLSSDGRVIDRDAEDRTTSEAQSYALFFALVANDRPRFNEILAWTEHNLAHSDLSDHLPAWLWGNKNGTWRTLDPNSASDADLWLAYTLLEAGRLWRDPQLNLKGQVLASLILQEEVAPIQGVGPILLPGRNGFVAADGSYELNASYLPVQLMLGLEQHTGNSSWRAMANAVPQVIKGSATGGFVMDWIAYTPRNGFANAPVPVYPPLGSYDAIRVYLYAGMLDAGSTHREEILRTLSPMAAYVEANGCPPAQVTAQGTIKQARSGVGFSAAVIPLLSALKSSKAANEQMRRLEADRSKKTGLYGDLPRYYDQNLALFATGWAEGRFRFTQSGLLEVSWR